MDGATTLYAQTLGYDGVSNVTSTATTLDISGATQTDNQAFCYNEQNQLTWAGATGTPPCGSSLTPGSLTAAEYTQSFSYDALGRLASATSGSYAYTDSAHPHGVTTISSPTSYSAAYNTAGDMICRAPTSAQTCAGTQTGWTGQALSYDTESRLTHWASFQHQAGTPSAADFLYDGSGQRVEQQDTPANQLTLTTRYVVGGLEEDTAGTLTKYLGIAGLPTAVRVGTSGTLAYLASDDLGSVSEALDGSGNVTAAQLYAPYGGARYSSGTMPTAKGFTGQRADAATGLDYYGARYYDPVAGQFTSADTVADGLSPYAYVKGNPETLTDPSGHRYACPDNNCGGGGGKNYVPGTTPTGKQQVQAAKKATAGKAQTNADYFQNIVLWLGLIGGVLGILGSAIMGSNPILGGFLLGLGLACGIIAVTAGRLQMIFADEASNPDSLSKDEIENAVLEVYDIRTQMGVVASMAGMSFMGTGWIRDLETGLIDTGEAISLPLSIAGMVGLIVGGTFSAFLCDQAAGDLQQEYDTLLN